MQEEHLATTARGGSLGPQSERPSAHGASFFADVLTKRPLSAHATDHFADLCLLNEGPSVKEAKPRSVSWTVHGGDFFAAAVRNGEARTPNERVYLNTRAVGAENRRPYSRAEIKDEASKLPGMSPLSDVRRIRRMRLMSKDVLKEGSVEMQAGRNSLALRLASQEESRAGAPASLGDGVVGINEFHLEPSNIKNLLGMGSYACVHMATRKRDDLQVAIKVFHRPISRGFDSPSNSAHGGKAWLSEHEHDLEEEEARALPASRRAGRDPRRVLQDTFHMEDALSFKMETRILADSALKHEHILAYLGHGFVPVGDDGKLAGFIVTSFVPGVDLYTTLQRSRAASPASSARICVAQVLRWSSQLASALVHMHAHGVVHRDIKETNLMISDAPGSRAGGGSQDLVLLDFGLAMRLVPPQPQLSHTLPDDVWKQFEDPSSVTTSRDLDVGFGIVGYRAPEVHRKRPFGLPVDVFAFGRVLYNMLSAVSKPPRNFITPSKLWAQLLFSLCPRGSLRGGWGYETIYCEPPVSACWPAALSCLALDCLSRDPSARPSAEAISKILAGEGADSDSP